VFLLDGIGVVAFLVWQFDIIGRVREFIARLRGQSVEIQAREKERETEKEKEKEE
jgi:hypothetical protein